MSGHRALFLDRDGVINVDHGYVYTPGRTEFIDGIFELCCAAKRADHLLVVITNQAGIGRGYYSEHQFLEYMDWVRTAFKEHHAALDAVYYCPHHPSGGVGEYRRECACRKPAPGMILRAQHDLGLDLARSTLVGDKESDMEAGSAAGVGSCIKIHALPLENASVTRTIAHADREQILACLNA